MKNYAFIAAPQELGAFKGKDGNPVNYQRLLVIFNETVTSDQTGDVVALRVVTYKARPDNAFVKTLKPGHHYTRLFFDEYGRFLSAE